MHDFFIHGTKRLKIGKEGNFDKFLKRRKIFTPIFEQEMRMFPCKIYQTRIETVISGLCK